MASNGFRVALHPECETELQLLASRGRKYEDSIGRTLARIDELFVEADAESPAVANWGDIPSAVPGLFPELDLRSIDPDDGRITVIAQARDDVLYLLSADLSTRGARQRATQRAAERARDLTWAEPE